MKTKTKTKMNLKTIMASIVTISTLVACQPQGGSQQDLSDLQGNLLENMTLEAGKTYKLSGGCHVKAGVTLTIEEGVTILAVDDNTPDYILIEQGAKIMAEGTATNPIVMTSESKVSGAWGGLHICGKAPINVSTGNSEIGNAAYGGTNINDNSGVVKYVRIEYTGYSLDEETESNGLTLYGVGKGTEIAYVQCYIGKDDGVEFFGGTVDVNHIIVSGCGDDSYDWTQGWCGKGEYLIADQTADPLNGDCLIEADNNSKTPDATPISHPILSKLTLIGHTKEGDKGIRLRAGTHVDIKDALVIGKTKSLTVETTQTETSLKEGVSILRNVIGSGAFSSKEGIYTETLFTADNKVSQDLGSIIAWVGTLNGAGAIIDDATDWTIGWSKK